GVFHVPLTGNDPQTAIWLTVGDESKQIWQTGQKAGAPPVKFKDVQVSVADDISQVDGVTFLVTALPPANAALDAQPAPYTPLPMHKYSVSLVSGTAQKDPNPNPKGAGWVGTFNAPPPQGRNVTLASPALDALGRAAAGVNPNLVTINLGYRTLNPANT